MAIVNLKQLGPEGGLGDLGASIGQSVGGLLQNKIAEMERLQQKQAFKQLGLDPALASLSPELQKVLASRGPAASRLDPLALSRQYNIPLTQATDIASMPSKFAQLALEDIGKRREAEASARAFGGTELPQPREQQVDQIANFTKEAVAAPSTGEEPIQPVSSKIDEMAQLEKIAGPKPQKPIFSPEVSPATHRQQQEQYKDDLRAWENRVAKEKTNRREFNEARLKDGSKELSELVPKIREADKFINRNDLFINLAKEGKIGTTAWDRALNKISWGAYLRDKNFETARALASQTTFDLMKGLTNISNEDRAELQAGLANAFQTPEGIVNVAKADNARRQYDKDIANIGISVIKDNDGAKPFDYDLQVMERSKDADDKYRQTILDLIKEAPAVGKIVENTLDIPEGAHAIDEDTGRRFKMVKGQRQYL